MRIVLIIALFILSLAPLRAQIIFGQKGKEGLSINYSNPKEYEIADIKVQGVQFLDNNALISLTGLRVGDKIEIPGDQISAAIKKLWKQGIIGDVSIYADRVEDGKVWLTVELKERPRLSRYEFEGLSKSQQGELKDKVELIRGKILTDVVLKNTELSVRKYLESKGYLNSDIRIIQEKDTILNNSVAIRILVDKNHKMKIKNINFYGDTIFSESKLRGKLKKTGELPRISLPTDLIGKVLNLLKPRNLVHFLTHRQPNGKDVVVDYLGEVMNVNVFKSSKYIKSDFEEDKENLMTFYNSKGYRDAEIVTDTVYPINDKYLNIDFRVEPGRKYYFNNIIWTGNYLYKDEFLDRILGIEKGDVYDLELVNKKLNFNPTGTDISSLYMDDGYLFFNITPIEVAINGDSVDLEMRIQEGVQATINEVTITGNEKTNDHVIRRELRTLPGEKFSRADLIRTQRELSQLGYFDPEQVNPIPRPNPADETVDIEWSLVERPNDQIELSGGWGGFYGFVGTLGVSFNNFSVKNIPHFDKWRPLPMGDGQRLSVRVQANGQRYQSYSLGFTEPWLGGRKRNSFGVNLSHSVQRSLTRFNDLIGKLEVSGLTVSLGRQINWPDDYFTLSNSLSFLRYDLYNFNRFGLFATGEANSITFNNTIARNSFDSPMYPRNGSSISLSASFTPPYSLWSNINYAEADNETLYKFLEYHKWNFDARYYLKLVGDLVFAPRMHFGYLGSYTNKVGVGPFERFMLGGDGLTGANFFQLGTDVIGLRGYENNVITPTDDSGLQGGTMFVKYVMELRYPVSLNPSATIYFLTFFDGGNNWNDFSQFNPYNVYRSAGLGVRIFMPAFGLMGLDWGYGFDPAPGQLEPSGPQFHFSIGQQIR